MITAIIAFSLGFASGVYRDVIAEKAKALFIKYSGK